MKNHLAIEEFESFAFESARALLVNTAARGSRLVASSVRSLVTATERRLKHFVITTDLRIRNIGVYSNHQNEHTDSKKDI
jgi:hypothetical protein